MKAIKNLLLLLTFTLSISSCSVPKYATISSTPDLSKYKYLYITDAGEKTSVTGSTFGSGGYVYGGTTSSSTNPTDIISGRFMKQGYVRIPELSEEKKPQTIIVNYGEGDRKSYCLGIAYSIEVTLQLLDAATYDLICVSTAEGMGETEADDIRLAINKCLDAIFK